MKKDLKDHKMSEQVLMPLMGEGVNEATVITWLKKPGDKVEKDEPLLEVSTDKVDTEIPSPVDGFLLAVTANEGDVIEVDQIIAHIGSSPDEEISQATTAKNQLQTEPEEKTSVPGNTTSQKFAHHETSAGGFTRHMPMETAGTVRSSPLVRNIARDHDVDLRLVRGTGQYGRITKDDLNRFMSGSDSTRIPLVNSEGGSSKKFIFCSG